MNFQPELYKQNPAFEDVVNVHSRWRDVIGMAAGDGQEPEDPDNCLFLAAAPTQVLDDAVNRVMDFCTKYGEDALRSTCEGVRFRTLVAALELRQVIESRGVQSVNHIAKIMGNTGIFAQGDKFEITIPEQL